MIKANQDFHKHLTLCFFFFNCKSWIEIERSRGPFSKGQPYSAVSKLLCQLEQNNNAAHFSAGVEGKGREGQGWRKGGWAAGERTEWGDQDLSERGVSGLRDAAWNSAFSKPIDNCILI